MSGSTHDPVVRWLDAPEEHDFPAAASSLSLIAAADVTDALMARFHAAQVVADKAKDILRAARLPRLDITNPHAASILGKIKAGTPLSPILLVRGVLGADQRLEIADGHHRVCACYHADENIDIPCPMVER